jgi:hypothetical protein
MKNFFVLTLIATGAALAAEEPEAVYRKLHAAAMARNLDEMLVYATEAGRAEMKEVPMMPKSYRITGKAAHPQRNAVQLRAAGTGDFAGLGYTQMFGTIDLVKKKGEWKIDHWSWSTDRPGEFPEGFVLVQGEAPPARSAAEPKSVAPPQTPPERPRLVTKPAEPAPVEKAAQPEPCVIKPVMTDDELRACGASIAQ